MNTIIISEIFEYFLLLSIRGSILAFGILIIKAALKQKLSAGFQYCIWFLLLFRLIVPFSLESPVHIIDHFPQYQQQVENNLISESDLSDIQSSNITDSNKNDSNKNDSNSNIYRNITFPSKGLNTIKYMVALLWLIGIVSIMVYIIIVNISLLMKVKKYPPCERKDIIQILDECKLKLNVNSKVTILYGKRLKSPMIFGVIHPRIIISRIIIDRLSQEELKHIFLHELSHIKRRDLVVNIFGTLIQAVYWFNPIIWYSINKMKQDCEISCDATVLNVLSKEENKKYGLTIINMMKMVSDLKWVSGSIGFASKYNSRRINMINLYKKASVKWTVVALMSLTLLTGCSSLTSPTKQSSSEVPNSTTGENDKNIQTQEENLSTEQDNESVNEPNTSKQDTTELSTNQDNNSNNESKSEDTDNSFEKYLKYLGLSKENLISTLNEKPTTVDEGGLEFKEAGIRIWFDPNTFTKVSQVFTQREDIDFNGVKIGDKIDEFKKAFGEPVSDNNGDMHFKYDNAYISVNYDTKTNVTFAVYLLSEDF